jgi:soluble lytic murein transglycosylase
LTLLAKSHFLILDRVIPRFFNNALHLLSQAGRIPEFTVPRFTQTVLALCVCAIFPAGPLVAQQPETAQRENFSRAWQAAAKGDRAVFEQLKPGLNGYLLYPYLQYEDFRYRRARVGDEEMSAFLETNEDWAFAPGLKTAWLRTLGTRDRWDSLIRYAPGSQDTEVQCYLARARIEQEHTEGLLAVAQGLWTVGKSQPDACDPVFKWLMAEDGISSGLAWERIRLAMEARQPRLTYYLAPFVAENERVWVERWQQQDRGGYRRLDQARNWGDLEKNRDITDYGIRRLARSDSDRAWQVFRTLDGHFNWPPDFRGGLIREIALWSAVEGADETPQRMQAVPDDYRDEQLMEWWVRHDLSRGNWDQVVLTIGQMPSELKDDTRWRYWDARAHVEQGGLEHGRKLLGELALEANYFGFLAADSLDLPYTICPEEPRVDQGEIDALKMQPGFRRALELRKAGIANWSRSEWKLAVRGLDKSGLRVAAALAKEESWPDMTIFALGNSGDLRWYEWRFPVEYGSLVETHARARSLDFSWVMGLMRSESAMAEDAISSAGARGLMQVMPQTAKQLAKRHAFSYTGRQQLMQADDNIQYGTAYLRELLDRFGDNPVLVSGAYNAGPHAVDRWLAARSTSDPAIWVETLPYFETRDYIPRVLAFTTIYDWRLNQPVTRISSRMPEFDSGVTGGTMQVRETAEVVCRTLGIAQAMRR